ncbi:MAG: AMP phosphorylase [Candidatus Bathyarchaeia archaeon]
MKLRSRILDIAADQPTVLLNQEDAERGKIHVNERVRLEFGGRTAVALSELTKTIVGRGEVGVYEGVGERLGLRGGEEVTVVSSVPPHSLELIKKKISGEPLTKDEISEIVRDIVSDSLTDVEIAAFVMSQQFVGMSMDEVEARTRALVEGGERINFNQTVYDKHSIGGVPGNKISLLIVPIVASMGLFIPKTSSKAITSPSGTADTMSLLAEVEFTPTEFKEVALKAGGAIVWGGKLGLAPADDILIRRAEHPLELDPRSQMMASIMAKKMAVGANCVVIDIPVGRGTKVETEEEGMKLASDFIELGRRLKIRTLCGLTYGSQPVGHAVGPALEAREALRALMGEGPTSLIEKSTAIAGLLLEAGGVAPPGMGQDHAKQALMSGKALGKMREIIEAQGGDPNIEPEDIPVGDHTICMNSPADGYVTEIDNAAINDIARLAGAPLDRGAGIVLDAKRGYIVKKDQGVLTIYADKASNLSAAYNLAMQSKPFTVEGMLLRKVPEYGWREM